MTLRAQSPFAAGEAFRVAAVNLTVVINADPARCTFTLKGNASTAGLFINPATGAIQGLIDTVGLYQMVLVALDEHGAESELDRVVLDVRKKDISEAAYGPGGKGCGSNGQPVDGTGSRFDKQFTCSCDKGFEGDNCDSVEIDGTDVVIGVLICILVIAVLVGAATKYRSHQRANAPTDFQAKLQEFNAKLETLKDQGLIDPEQPAKERVPRELRREWVTTIDRLGHGKFGEVWKGLLADAGNATHVPEYLVAVKVALRPSGSEDTAAAAAAAEDELLNEALLMAQVESHRHLVSLVGVVTRGHPKMLVLSFCEHGELQGMLKRRAGNGDAFGMLTKHRFCAEIAAGMSVLASNHVVHRDLATRNVLLASGMVCKVGDFGMSRQVQTDDNTGDYYRRCDRTHAHARSHMLAHARACVKRLILC